MLHCFNYRLSLSFSKGCKVGISLTLKACLLDFPSPGQAWHFKFSPALNSAMHISTSDKAVHAGWGSVHLLQYIGSSISKSSQFYFYIPKSQICLRGQIHQSSLLNSRNI